MQKIIVKFAPYIMSLVIAVMSFFTGMSDVGESVQIALDKDKAIAQAAEIISETPTAEIKKAVEAEK